MRLFKTHPLLKLVNSYVVDSPQPSNLSYWWNFGSLLAFSLIIQIVTGVTLAMHYNTDILEAFNSVEHIMRDINNGWLIRYLHSNTASAFFFIVYLHIGRGLYYGSYKAPRTLVWAIGTIIFISMMATAFLGYVLPFGQMSLWGATVITSLMSAIPWVGQDIVEFIWGGFSVNHATLNRFFALHFVLPFLLAALALMHLIALHDRAGSGNPLGISGNPDRLPFAPYYIFKDLITIFIFILVLSVFVFYMPNLLGDSENYVMANPMQTPPAIVPEWYLLPFYAILRSIPNKLLGVIAMFSAILMLLVMAFVDMTTSRGIQFKPLNKIMFFLFVGNFLALTQLGAEHVESPFIEYGQISTILYFSYFLIIIPYVSLFENGLTELWLEKDLYKKADNGIENSSNEETEFIVPEYAVVQSNLLGGYKLAFSYKKNYNDTYKMRAFHTTNPLKFRIDDEDPDQSNTNDNHDNIVITDHNTNNNDTERTDTDRSVDEYINSYYNQVKDQYDEYVEKFNRYEDLIKSYNKGEVPEVTDEDIDKACHLSRESTAGTDKVFEACKENIARVYKTEGIQDYEAKAKADDKVYSFLDNGPLYDANEKYDEKATSENPSDNYKHLKDSLKECVLPESYNQEGEESEDSEESEQDEENQDNKDGEQGPEPSCESNCDAPRPWGIYFQDSGTPQMEALVELHDNIVFYLIIILFGVGWLLMTIISKFGDMASPLSQRFSSHGTTIEIIWTVTPGIILILIAFPSFKLLYLMDEITDPIFAIFAEGHQWYWSYQYVDFLNDDYESLEFDSYLIPEADLEDGALRMLEVDNRLIVPELTHIRFVVQGGDVIHSFASPALGLKCDAYPGRLNQSSFMISRASTFYGQCSEICGILHSSMPTVIEAVSSEKFVKWLLQQ